MFNNIKERVIIKEKYGEKKEVNENVDVINENEMYNIMEKKKVKEIREIVDNEKKISKRNVEIYMKVEEINKKKKIEKMIEYGKIKN
jgi:hypothetical protein